MGYKKNGVDLDTLLEPWQAGDGNAAATGYKINNADLNTRYAPASAGTGYTGGTGYKQNGADIGPRFCAKGTRAAKVTPDNGDLYTSRVIVPNGGSRSAGIEMYLSSLSPLQYTVGPDGSASQPTPQTFDVPAGMAYFRTTLTLSSGTAADVVTQHTAWTAMNTLNQTLAEIVSAVYAYASGSHTGTYTCTLEFSADGVNAAYTGSTTWVWLVDGSV